jgi:hypothetical protein
MMRLCPVGHPDGSEFSRFSVSVENERLRRPPHRLTVRRFCPPEEVVNLRPETASTAEAVQIGHAEVMRLFLLAAIALPLLPGQPKDFNRERDADGFGNIKWGMTVAEAKAAFPGLLEPERPELTSGAFEERLIQPVLMIGNAEMTVSIQTKADSDLITRIVLKLAPAVQHRKTAFQFLRDNLIQNYGRPSHHTAPRGRMKEETEVWILPSTTITLDWREESASKFRALDITYQATDKLPVPFL